MTTLHPFLKVYAIANLIINPILLLAVLTTENSDTLTPIFLGWVILSGLGSPITRQILVTLFQALMSLGCGGASVFGIIGFLILAYLLAMVATIALIAMAVILWLNALYLLYS